MVAEEAVEATRRPGKRITQRNLDYLKVIYRLGGYPGGCRVRISDIAKSLNVSTSTVSIMVRRLESKGLLDVAENQGVCLTQKGLEVLAEYLWKHAILEISLVKAGLPPDISHEVADSLCQHLERELAWKLYEALGRPKKCPHGMPIPVPGEKLAPSTLYCGLVKPGE